jgi:hypothetical protein
MEQNYFWEADSISAVKKFPIFYATRTLLQRPIMIQSHPHGLFIFQFRFWDNFFFARFSSPSACFVSRLPHPPWPNYSRKIKWIIQIMKIFTFLPPVGFEVFTAVVMKSIIFWDVKPCSPLSVARRFGGTRRLHLPTCLLAGFYWTYFFYPEDGGDMFLRNACWNSIDYTASYPKRWYSSFLPPLFHSSPLDPNILFSALFSDIIYSFCSLTVGDHVSHPNKTRTKTGTTIACNLILGFPDERREELRF